jgi:hypothetical protein
VALICEYFPTFFPRFVNFLALRPLHIRFYELFNPLKPKPTEREREKEEKVGV